MTQSTRWMSFGGFFEPTPESLRARRAQGAARCERDPATGRRSTPGSVWRQLRSTGAVSGTPILGAKKTSGAPPGADRDLMGRSARTRRAGRRAADILLAPDLECFAHTTPLTMATGHAGLSRVRPAV